MAKRKHTGRYVSLDGKPPQSYLHIYSQCGKPESNVGFRNYLPVPGDMWTKMEMTTKRQNQSCPHVEVTQDIWPQLCPQTGFFSLLYNFHYPQMLQEAKVVEALFFFFFVQKQKTNNLLTKKMFWSNARNGSYLVFFLLCC